MLTTIAALLAHRNCINATIVIARFPTLPFAARIELRRQVQSSEPYVAPAQRTVVQRVDRRDGCRLWNEARVVGALLMFWCVLWTQEST